VDDARHAVKSTMALRSLERALQAGWEIYEQPSGGYLLILRKRCLLTLTFRSTRR
jgi:hypothetical protein